MKENDIIKKKILFLDKEKPDFQWDSKDLWSEIENKQNNKSRWLGLKIAASVSIILVSSLFLIMKKGMNTEEISYSTEKTSKEEAASFSISQEENVALEFILSQCKNRTIVCEKPGFKTLRNELNGLDTEIKELDQMIKQYGNDPVFVKSKIQIENMRSEITNKLIQMVLS